MKNIIKKSISLLLVLTMLFAVSSTAFAAKNVTPVVVVPGLGAAALYENPNTEQEQIVGNVNFDLNFVAKLYSSGLITQALQAMGGQSVDNTLFIQNVKKIAFELGEKISCNPDGTPKYNNIDVNSFWQDSLANHQDYLDSKNTNEPAVAKQIANQIGADNVYVYHYDWRKDVVDDANNLNKFIENVKQQKNCNKITLVSCSLGTCVASAYLDTYGNDSLEKCIFLSPAFKGTAVAGELFNKNLYINADVIKNYVKELSNTMTSSDINMSAINAVVSLLGGSIPNIVNFINTLIDENLDQVYDEIILPIVGNIPAYWEVMNYSSYNSAVEKINPSPELKAKLDRYFAIQNRLEDNLKKAKSNGVEIAIVAHYGTPAIPATQSYKWQSDVLIDTVYASGGATVANYGETLKIADNKYLSKDNVIDASTCIMPDNTWFIKGVQHMDYKYDQDSAKFIAYLVSTDTPISINMNSNYPQFMKIDSSGNISPVTKPIIEDVTNTTNNTQNVTTTTQTTNNSTNKNSSSSLKKENGSQNGSETSNSKTKLAADKQPNMGDNFSFTPYIALAVVAFAVIAFVIVIRKKDSKS